MLYTVCYKGGARAGRGDQLSRRARSQRACSAPSASSAAMQRELLDSPAEPVCMAAGRSPGNNHLYHGLFLNIKIQ